MYKWIVVCLDDKRGAVLATSKMFDSSDEARRYAKTVNPKLYPEVLAKLVSNK